MDSWPCYCLVLGIEKSERGRVKARLLMPFRFVDDKAFVEFEATFSRDCFYASPSLKSLENRCVRFFIHRTRLGNYVIDSYRLGTGGASEETMLIRNERAREGLTD